MRATYRILAMLIAVGVVVQAAAIAFALFDIAHKTDDGQVFTKDTENGGIAFHAVLGEMVIPLLALVLLIVSFFARIPGGVKWAAITFGLVVVQIALAFAGRSVPLIGALHALNAFALAGVASIAGRQARLGGSAPAGEPAAV
jgi:Family of unknown function (DUF6220)